jgi:hypothetical protein
MCVLSCVPAHLRPRWWLKNCVIVRVGTWETNRDLGRGRCRKWANPNPNPNPNPNQLLIVRPKIGLETIAAICTMS